MKVSIHMHGARALAKDIRAMKKAVRQNCLDLVEDVVQTGEDEARVLFGMATYDGENDVIVTSKVKGLHGTVDADGFTVGFIEFGTGVRHPDDHPNAPEFGAIHGTYGYGYGKKGTWVYKGSPGTHGKKLPDGRVLTHGNPSNKCMYFTAEKMRREMDEKKEGVFKT